MTYSAQERAWVARNPNTRKKALTVAYHLTLHNVSVPQDECDHLAALVYGYAHSGEMDAKRHWTELHNMGFTHPANNQSDTASYAGDLMWWEGGKHWHVGVRAAHEASVYSPDIEVAGRYSLVPITEIHERWGYRLLGHSAPIFPHGVKS